VTIPIAAPVRWFEQHQQAVAAAVAGVVSGGQYILGPRVEAFERAFAAFCACPHAVAVASGTDAITLALRVLDVAGKEVITSAHTAMATVAAIECAGATPVLADIDPASHCLCPESVASVLSPRTRAIVAVHIFGHPADLHGLRAVTGSGDIGLVEDCAQAHGASIDGSPVGSFGLAGAFSFYPTKNIGALGDAGAVVTRDEHVARQLRQLRQYGWDETRRSLLHGQNSRMDEVQAAILALRLADFPAAFARRQQIAQRYNEALANHPHVLAPETAPGATHAFHLYVVRTSRPDALAAQLLAEGIQTARHYTTPIHRQPAYRDILRAKSLRNVERLYETMLSIPVYPELTDQEVDRICEALSRWRAGGN
jgi:dTDP-4-amino-4,6-dideoxygalactose transaminase